MRLFKDRNEAAQALAARLATVKLEAKTVILALPRGGVPVAWEVAQRLKFPLDLLFIKKIGAPKNPELAMGAVSEDGNIAWQKEIISKLNLSPPELMKSAEAAKTSLDVQAAKLRHGKKPLNLKGRTVIVIDDGLATGATLEAAITILRSQQVKKIIVGVPVASRSAASHIGSLADQLICLRIPEPFFSVGQWYEDFGQVTDEEVLTLMGSHLSSETSHSVQIPAWTDDSNAKHSIGLQGQLVVPRHARGAVIFAHGRGSSHLSPRHRKVAQTLHRFGFATLLFDLLSPDESETAEQVFNIPLLTKRLLGATQWLRAQPELADIPIGYFGASTGAAAAISAAALDPDVRSVVSRGGRPDLASEDFKSVHAQTLLIAGGNDTTVLELNKMAQKELPHCELIVVPGAGHLFEEAGALDQVVEYAVDWFEQTLATSRSSSDPHILPRASVSKEIEHRASPLESSGALDALAEQLSRHRIVMLGEASHGTQEFYEIRRELSQRLIQRHDFNLIAVEGDWPDCYRLNDYIHNSRGDSARAVMEEFKRWPTWMWANTPMETLIEWLRGTHHTGLYGLDVYSLYESMNITKDYLLRIDPGQRNQLLEAYSCFDSFNSDEIAYAKSLLKMSRSCEDEVLEGLRKILRLRLEATNLHEDELFDLQQNSRIIRNAEAYYRAMLHADSESWNIRDAHMLETLDALLNRHGANAKAIVWAHNTHIGDYHATDMAQAGLINLGGLARERWGMDQIALVGFGTYSGEVLAAKAWGARAEVMPVAPAQPGSYEDYFHQAALLRGWQTLFLSTAGSEPLGIRRGHRAIGVVYQPVFEEHSRNYVPTELSRRYDYFIFVDKTSALKALPGSKQLGLIPETWPTGA